jgi:hypothetical protein
LVLACGGRKNASDLGDSNNSMDSLEAFEVRDHAPFLDVENDQLVRVHVGDVKPAILGIVALVIKSNRGTGERQFRDKFQDSTTGFVLGILRRDDVCREKQAKNYG